MPNKQKEMLLAALELLKAGKPVVPVNRNTKRPYVKWKQFQDRLPTEKEIREWWKRWPDANVAIVTGRLSKRTILDCDSAEASKQFVKRFPEAITTRQVRTGRTHFIFLDKDGVPSDGGKTL